MYRIKLTDFEGPLDLLLFFIKRDELDIYDIPIAKITKDFLEYLEYLQDLDLDIAGEFIVTAAELMQVKVQMLLPRPVGEGEEELDPRAELVRRLLDYKRYKEMAEELQTMSVEQSQRAYRKYFMEDSKIIEDPNEENLLRDVTLFDLIAAFKYVVERMPRKHVHEINKLNVTLEDQIEFILKYFKDRNESTFLQMVELMAEKIRIVVTFIALLELIKQKQIGVRQVDPYGEMVIVKLPVEVSA
ncbi:MAG TPA: segregation/condensation protein A [Bacteroidota bacterium]|nr:segregation/condensation protein A [Bacteroidota bacterium]